MTDFDKTARDIAASYGHESCPDCLQLIATALKAAYNEGLRDSITRIEDLFQKVP